MVEMISLFKEIHRTEFFSAKNNHQIVFLAEKNNHQIVFLQSTVLVLSNKDESKYI